MTTLATAFESPAPHRHDRVLLLDGLRGLAALVVVFGHLSTVRSESGEIFAFSYLSVDLFFILSGFVLTLAFEPKLERLGTFEFMRLRVLRLWPALTVGAVLGAIYHFTRAPAPLVFPYLVLTLMMVPNMGQGMVAYSFNPPQWSLAFELVANLFHALLLRRLTDRQLAAFCAVSGAIFAVEILVYGTASLGAKSDDMIFGLARVAFGYGLGVWLGRRWRGEPAAPTKRWWLALAAPVATIIFIGLLPRNLQPAGEFVAVLIALPLLFHQLGKAKAPAWADPWLDRLGALSYPVYAIHTPILALVALMNTRHFPQVPVELANAAAVAIVVAAAQAMSMFGVRFRRARRRNAPQVLPA